MEKRAVINAKDLSIGYKSKGKINIVHKNLNFTLYTGELTSLIGANGAGKSTLLRTLSLSQPSIDGELNLMKREIESFTEKEISKIIGIVLTDKTYTGGLTVYELVALGRQPHTGFFGRLHKKDHCIIEKALESVGISHKSKSYCAELSDGERQKVMIAKALVQECPIILLDEPTAFLDVVSRIEIMNLLHKLAREQNKAILLSSHDIEQALVLSDKLWLISKENGIESGVTEDMIVSHKMDNLFCRDNIKFDYDHGVYYPIVKCFKKIMVNAEDKTLLHWTINALNRNGYSCMLNKQENESLDSVEVKSTNEFIIDTNNELIKCSSFENLLDSINKKSLL